LNKNNKAINEHLKKVAYSYDTTSDLWMRRIDEYIYLPTDLWKHSNFSTLFSDKWTSGTNDIQRFLKPKPDQKFLDLGCFHNLYRYSIHEWPSRYFGVDISRKSIFFLKKTVKKRRIKIGGLIVASIENLPFNDNYFEIAACLNVFEYYPISYVKQAVKEIHRVMKNKGKIVLDILNIDHPAYDLAIKIENFFNRPNLFKSSRKDFEKLLDKKFIIHKKNDKEIMVRYYLEKI
jgi:SAM-dependent methyltransferase